MTSDSATRCARPGRASNAFAALQLGGGMHARASKQVISPDSIIRHCIPNLRTTRLAIGIAVGSLSSAAAASTSPPAAMYALIKDAAPPRQPDANPPWPVQNCDDDGPGSLRNVIATLAQSGDTIDLGHLNCSTITLTSGEIAIAQSDLDLIGPVSGGGLLTISGNDASRVFNHAGVGTFNVQSITVSNGYNHQSGINNQAKGGCVFSAGSVHLNHAVVENCTAKSDDDLARGGGLYAQHEVRLSLSTVTGNQAIATPSNSHGGGILCANLVVKYSSITTNSADLGGGAFARVSSSTMVFGSTISSNQGSKVGGLLVHGSLIVANSTLSGNSADHYSALAVEGPGGGSILNTTIAFNHAVLDASKGAVDFWGDTASTTFTLQSSIIANNTAGAANTPSDLYLDQGILAGAHNLVVATNVSPPGVITIAADPKLGPLKLNGGFTQTHALLPGSPAIAMGDNAPNWVNEQRGPGYARTSGPNASTDIGAFRFDTIFVGPLEEPVLLFERQP